MEIFKKHKISITLGILSLFLVFGIGITDAARTSTTGGFEPGTADLEMGGFDINNIGTSTADHFVATSTTESSILGHFQPITDSLYDIGTAINRFANGYFDNIDTATITISGASAGNLDMGGFDITNAGEITGTHLTATSTTATSTFAGEVNITGETWMQDSLTLLAGVPTLIFDDNHAGHDKYRLRIDNDLLKIGAGSPVVDIMTFDSSNGNNVGIGTTSPYAKLSVVGETVSEFFTATSTTATSTFAGGLTVGSFLSIDPDGNLVGIGSTTPFATLSVTGRGTGTDYAFQVTDSANAPLFSVQDNGTTTVSAATAATSTAYIYSTGAGLGGAIILEDTDGAGCSLITTLDGVITGQTITCPTE